MIEIIGFIACLIACVGVPYQVSAIRSGAAFQKAPDKRAMDLTATRKQFRMLSWVGIGLGLIEIGLSFVPDEPGEAKFKLAAGVVWLVLSGLCFWALRRIADVPLVAPGA